MTKTLEAVGICVEPGRKYEGYAQVPWTDYRFPVTIINGTEDGKILLVSAGIHGCEYPGMLATLKLAGMLDPAGLHGAVMLPHIINVSGFEERVPYVVPADEKRQNLNRLFPGDPQDMTLAGRIVRFVGALAAGCDFHIDLHSGDMVEDLVPLIITGNGSGEALAQSIAAAKVTGFSCRMPSGGRTEYYNSTIIDHGKPALLFERGCAGTWTEKEVDEDVRDILAIARYLHILPGEAPENEAQRVTDRKCWMSAAASGLFFPAVKAGDPVREGQLLFMKSVMSGDRCWKKPGRNLTAWCSLFPGPWVSKRAMTPSCMRMRPEAGNHYCL